MQTTEEPVSTGEITNTCTCTVYDEEAGEYTDEPTSYCFGDCWDFALEDFAMVTEELRDSNNTGWWKVSNLNLWDREVSGYFHATKVDEIINGMTVNSAWSMRYKVFTDRIEYSVSHHDSMGGNTTLTPVSEEKVEELGLY